MTSGISQLFVFERMKEWRAYESGPEEVEVVGHGGVVEGVGHVGVARGLDEDVFEGHVFKSVAWLSFVLVS